MNSFPMCDPLPLKEIHVHILKKKTTIIIGINWKQISLNWNQIYKLTFMEQRYVAKLWVPFVEVKNTYKVHCNCHCCKWQFY